MGVRLTQVLGYRYETTARELMCTLESCLQTNVEGEWIIVAEVGQRERIRLVRVGGRGGWEGEEGGRERRVGGRGGWEEGGGDR